MFRGDRDQDTICAVSTPHGVGGISVIRVSGPRTLSIVSQICQFLPEHPESHKVYFGVLTATSSDHETSNEIDEVLATYFKHGRSFTGEEVIEISCHGSPVICQSILQQLVLLGARPADRGEFTYRAFMNGKLDLVQAESVLSLIESQSQQAARLALRQLKGSVSHKLEDIENDMTWILAHAEAGIDFSTEGIKVVENDVVLGRLDKIENGLEELVGTFKVGRLLKDGFRVVLTGLPNVGKSSLLNLFLEDERAIVTDIPGTTRDVIHGDTSYKGVKFTFLDTAGLRESVSDLVEKIGIQKSREATGESDVVFFVFDIEQGLSAEELSILDGLDPQRTYILANKTDRLSASPTVESVEKSLKNSKFFQKIGDLESFLKRRVFFVSALDKKVRSRVLEELVKEFADLQMENTVLISNSRHLENLSRALENTRRSKGLVEQGMGEEFLAIELKEALIAIHETLGKRFDDQIMDRVFKEFCIGK
ncbi:tRNA uridine-5-carboxymethylaminomethyl(34) synthesis GTPase MnmE [Bdellovibrio sp. 22V]|uniref:tRNA uridine-5-carboxymethylaminomethyl(34) synthesis GTPase MnmE n=1 Tax=Bdellovibrio sp. 22V TaxID=3044166 RepID=UPI002543622C|nr:tRNA uridine-5-carboxymethylaminomethyl(34) synthesis GTPase MnmE [Bdellovibrio sp. 22V]WII73022.1 tRNA uridine-5-carboxymethylaminomethyl(34) synthesis GTPase MnmE [Bdellovibrio sp. 22V]